MKVFFISFLMAATFTSAFAQNDESTQSNAELDALKAEVVRLEVGLKKVTDGLAGLNDKVSNSTKECRWTDFVVKWDLELNLTCQANEVMKGISFSHPFQHNLVHEESVRLYCCRL